MLGSSEAPLLASYPQLAPPQIAMQPIAEQPSIGAQDQTDNDPTSQHAVDKDTDKDSSGLVRDTACKLPDCFCATSMESLSYRCFRSPESSALSSQRET